MKMLPLLLFCFAFATLAQTPADVVSTSQGDLKIQPILHGSVVLQWGDQVIYVDPYGGAAAYAGLPAPTLVLITDIHGDHLHPATLEALDTKQATFVVPQAVADQLADAYKQKLVVISNGESKTVNGIPIAAIPMYNLPETEDSRHPKGRGNGYIVSLGDKKVYFSGDTEDIEEMRALRQIDVAFVCMNLPYTMNIEQAASAVLAFQPKIVYPYHYRGQGGLSDTAAFAKLVNDSNSNIEVRLRNWYP